MVEFSFKIASTDYNIQKKNLPQITFVNLAKIEKKLVVCILLIVRKFARSAIFCRSTKGLCQKGDPSFSYQ